MEWRNVKKEEDKKIKQRAVQPAANGFTPTSILFQGAPIVKNNLPLYEDPYGKVENLDDSLDTGQFRTKFKKAVKDAQENYLKDGGKDWRPIRIISTARNNMEQAEAMLSMLFDEKGYLIEPQMSREKDFINSYIAGKANEKIFNYVLNIAKGKAIPLPDLTKVVPRKNVEFILDQLKTMKPKDYISIKAGLAGILTQGIDKGTLKYIHGYVSRHLEGRAVDIDLKIEQYPAYTNYIKVEFDKYFRKAYEDGCYHLGPK